MVDMTTMSIAYELPNVGCLLGIAYQAEVSRLAAALREAGIDISAAEYLIMRILYAADGAVQECEISLILIKDKASVSRSIRSLERKGLVLVSQKSYKCSMVSLTEEGERLRHRLMEIAAARHRKLVDRITPEQMDTLREILETIID